MTEEFPLRHRFPENTSLVCEARVAWDSPVTLEAGCTPPIGGANIGIITQMTIEIVNEGTLRKLIVYVLHEFQFKF